RDLPGGDLLAGADDPHDLRAHALNGDVEALQHARGQALLLAEQPEQDVLGADVVVLERARLLLRKNDHLPGPFCKSLEHGVFLPARTVPQALCRLIDASCAVYQQAPATYPGGLGRGSSTPHDWAQEWPHRLRKADGVRPRECAGWPAGACACREMIRMRIICRAACG